MTSLVLDQAQVRALLPMETCIELVERALVALARGAGSNPLRRGLLLPERAGVLGCMPGSLREPQVLGAKLITVVPANRHTELDTHQGVVVLLDPSTGVPRAILDGSEITALRTAAASAVATRALAPTGAGDLALLGSSVQARTHLAAMRAVRELRRVRVFSPTAAHREAFCEAESRRHGIEIEPCADAHSAVEDADLVCTVTGSSTPVLEGAWLAPGAHVNAAGACAPRDRELDDEAILRARVFVDSREAAWAEAGDLRSPRDRGLIDEAHVLAELGEVLTGAHPGRTDERQITVFESLGLAVEDLACADHVWRRARAEGVGTAVALGGAKHPDV